MNKLIITMCLAVFSSNASASKEAEFFAHYNAWERSDIGCELNGRYYEVGELEAVNLSDLKQYEAETGLRPSDGYAVMMMCTFLVEPTDEDYPKPDKRKFVWVAF